MLTALQERAILSMAPRADIAGPVLMCLSRPTFPRQFDEKSLCTSAGLPLTQVTTVIELLLALKQLGMVSEQPGMLWEATADIGAFAGLTPLLEAIEYYRARVHRDQTTAEVVLTRPAHPSKLEEAMREFGYVTGHVEHTSEAFSDLALSANKSLVVMTPFLDRHGGEWLGRLLRQTKPTVHKSLILRYLRNPSQDAYPDGIDAIRQTIAELDVELFDYAIPRTAGGFETFHAKVIIADGNYAYVGSANLNRASLEYSMELGVLLRGEAALRIAQIVDAIKRACTAGA